MSPSSGKKSEPQGPCATPGHFYLQGGGGNQSPKGAARKCSYKLSLSRLGMFLLSALEY
jgi:hypothetical protein